MGNSLSIEAIRGSIEQDMREVDKIIRMRLHSDVPLVRQVAEYIINSGGKRMRPALVILSANAFGYRGTHHYDLAAVVEFIHTATLLHDDVVDGSALRRNRPTANALFGNSASVLVGDFVYSRSFQMMVEVDSMRVMRVLADTTNVIAEGEVMQLLNCHNADLDEQGYLRVIRCKTAKLFEAATRLGAILGNASRTDEEAMASYGMHLGIAYQLIDDVLDYSGDRHETGKNIGEDLTEGKPTLPLIYAMKNAGEERAAVIRKAIEEGGLKEFETVLDTIHETRALEYARAQAEAEAQAARESCAALPRSVYRESLLQLADFAVSRTS